MVKTIFSFILGLILWIVLSALPAWALTLSFNLSSISSSAVFAGFLFITNLLNGLFISLKKSQEAVTEAQIYAEKNKYQYIEINCFKCRQMNTVPILLNKENKFKCENCGSDNKVIHTFKTIHPAEKYSEIDIDNEILNGQIDA